MKKNIYFNNCLTSKPAPEVIEAMLPYLKDKFFFPENFIANGSEAQRIIESAKETIAKTINADAEELHFTSSGTVANNLAIKGFLSENSDKGNHIICSVNDYPDILTNAAFFEDSGFDVTYLKCDEQGFIDLKELEQAINEETILMMTTLVNHTSGTIQPLAKIREILDRKNKNVKLLVDAGQAYARMPIDVKEFGIDLMSFSAHKIHGPQGIGALYKEKNIRLAQIQHGISRIDDINTGAISIANIVGFEKAAELGFSNLDKKIDKIRDLSNYLLQQIEMKIPDTLLNGPRGADRICHNINISFDFIEGEAIMMMMDMHGVTISTGSACASQGLKPNYILMAMGRNHEQSHSSMKFTLSRYNTKEEIDFTVKKLAEVVQELRSRSPLY